MIKKTVFVVFFLLGISSQLYSQDKHSSFRESFEDKAAISDYDTGGSGNLTLTDKHRRFGKSSLQWKWSGQSYFGTSDFQFLSRKQSPLAYGDMFPASPTLVMSVYNEDARQDSIRISYGEKDNEKVWFDLPLNFTGWRTVWVPFYRMSGDPPPKTEPVDYNYFKVSSTSENSSGTLFFDDIVFSQYQDDRHPYPDMMVPFVKDKASRANHWMPLIENMQRLRQFNPGPVSDAEKQGLMEIKDRLQKHVTKSGAVDDPLSKALETYKKLNLTTTNHTVLGPPLTYQIKQVYFEADDEYRDKYIDIRDFGQAVRGLAKYYLAADEEDKEKIAGLFVTAARYYLDQGWQAGSSGGTRHHIGYGIRTLTEAFYIMKVPLEEEGLLDEVGNSLAWLQNLGKILGPPKEFDANIDYFNTQAIYQMMTIFLFSDKSKQAALLNAYSDYLSVTLAQQAEKGVFKPDGTSWHHGGHYPAYGIGAFQKVPHLIYILSKTPFQIEAKGHENFKKAFLTTRLYSQLYDWGFGNAGRHPFWGEGIRSLKEEYLKMVYSGNPQHTSEIDREVAAAYLRLWGKEDEKNSEIFKQKYGIKEEDISGYYVLPYAATAIHRRDSWAAIMKGYSKYVWASEIYVDENRYGRYPANGSIQLYNEGGNKGSGFKQAGWNWNRYPGTTAIVLPFEELEPDTPLIMFRSDETFAGAASLDKNGVFGLKLDESEGSNAEGPASETGFPGKLKANKSVFSFGDKLISIGTGISSVDEQHPVQTNLFQNYLPSINKPIHTSEAEKITQFPYGATISSSDPTEAWVIDAYGNGFHVLSDTKLNVRRETQWSYNPKYSVNTGKTNENKMRGPKITKGDYATAWLDHGTAPGEASYQYVIYPFLEKEVIANFEDKTRKDNSYAILKADNTAHIVKDIPTSTTGYVIFKSGKRLTSGRLKAVSDPSIIMIKERESDSITISAVQPDLNFKENTFFKYGGYSYPVELKLTIAGKWQLDGKKNAAIKSIDVSQNETVITMENRHGFSNIINLSKQ